MTDQNRLEKSAIEWRAQKKRFTRATHERSLFGTRYRAIILFFFLIASATRARLI